MDNRVNDIYKIGVIEICGKSIVFLVRTERRAE